MKKSYSFLLFFLTMWASSALAAPSAFVTIPPQKFLVERVSGGTVPVSIMVEPGANPHAYEPKPRQMTALATAAVYFSIGDSFDQTWLPRLTAANPNIAIVHTDAGIAKIPMAAHHHEEHGSHDAAAEHEHHEQHGQPDSEEHHHENGQPHAGHEHNLAAEEHTHHDAEHEHSGLDPHIWLDPALVKIQAAHIRDGLTRVDPANAHTYAANTAAFLAELDQLDQEIRAILAPLPEERRTFLVFHPSWGYFAHAYGLRQMPIEIEGKEPSPKDLKQIITLAKETGASVIFVQPQFSEKSAAVIAKEIGAHVVRLDPLAEEWADNMRHAARAFAEALRK